MPRSDSARTLQLEGNAAQIAEEVVREILDRLFFLNEVGLGYLSLERRADTLSGGEAQRIRLAAQVGSGSGRWSWPGRLSVADRCAKLPA